MDEDFEVVRRAWAAFSRMDETTMPQTLHPEVVAVPFGAAMEDRAYHGPEEVMGWCSPRSSSAWETGSS